jgi:Fur family transcriptional regulator, ferric uptake regulator
MMKPQLTPLAPRLAERFDRIVRELRASGRLTAARRAIVHALLTADDHHVTAEELSAKVALLAPDVHLSTVYRTLEALETLGIVDHVHLGHGSAVYHLADERHQHLVCEACGGVVQVPDSVFAALATQLDKEFGFQIQPHHFAVPGVCKHCRNHSG